MAEVDFNALMVPVAEAVWGEPNKRLSNDREIRWGGQGGRMVNVEKGQWHDFTNDTGGGVFALIAAHEGYAENDKAACVNWLVEMGLIEDRKPEASTPKQISTAPRENEKPSARGEWTIVENYPYTDPDGNLLYEVCRIMWKLPDGSWEKGKNGKPKKTFIQRRKARTGDQAWIWSLKPGWFMRRGPGHDWKAFDEQKFAQIKGGEKEFFGEETPHGLYRWPEVEIGIADGKQIFLVEGEKDVHTLEKLGFVATTNSGGAGNWTPELAQAFNGADVVIGIDNDAAGHERARKVAPDLLKVAESVKVLDLAKFWPDMPEKADITDWVEQGGTAEKLLGMVAQIEQWTPPKPVSKFGAVTWEEIDGPGRHHDWLIKGLVERGGVGIVAGPSMSGKSFFMIDMAMAIALGNPYQNRAVRKGLVIYQAGEGGRGLRKRVKGYRQYHGVDAAAHVPFVLMDGKLDLYTDDNQVSEFITEAARWAEWYPDPLELVVIDTFSAATPGANENASDDISRVLKRCNRIADELNCTVMLVHHMNAKGERLRGHTSLGANVANVIEVNLLEIKDANGRPIRRAELKKNKDGVANFGWRFVLKQEIVGKDQDGDPITTCVTLKPAGDDEDQTSPGTRLTDQERLAFSVLLDVLDTHGQPPEPSLQLPRDVTRVAPYKLWHQEVFNRWSFGDAPNQSEDERAEARRIEFSRAWRRIGTSLKARGVLGTHNGENLVWWTGKEVKGERRTTKGFATSAAFDFSEQEKLETPF